MCESAADGCVQLTGPTAVVPPNIPATSWLYLLYVMPRAWILSPGRPVASLSRVNQRHILQSTYIGGRNARAGARTRS